MIFESVDSLISSWRYTIYRFNTTNVRHDFLQVLPPVCVASVSRRMGERCLFRIYNGDKSESLLRDKHRINQ